MSDIYLSIAIFYSVVHGAVLALEPKSAMKMARKMPWVFVWTTTALLSLECIRILAQENYFYFVVRNNEFIYGINAVALNAKYIVVQAVLNMSPYIFFILFVSLIMDRVTRWLRDIYRSELGDLPDFDLTIEEKGTRWFRKKVNKTH